MFVVRQIHQVVDQPGDFLFVRQRGLEHCQRRVPFARYAVDGLQQHAAPAFVDEIEELHRVDHFFIGLQTHPLRHAGEIFVFEVRHHRQIDIGGVKFGVDLVVHGRLHFVA